ncbi:uncharacterized protein BX663DRAFT_517471 [Cokeromyces recurvatus]|uniref:uncharacterized protein n=1 Tax=Cokeromyces recurvatus TaxID=90255 RepID=UPI00221ECA9A|nr:uncharacterized protein BX663DRAFT_517471 [Cokeromyces recurvatus]KAI7900410.1 hypothetical protein BX663DRAFT_517471 [Cokeromyces recurvatus]
MSDFLIKRSPDDFDWTTTICLYVILIILGIGMCFCLKRANRLIPNRFSFPLVDRGNTHTRLYDLNEEEEGLLSHYSDVESEDDAEVIDNQNGLRGEVKNGDASQSNQAESIDNTNFRKAK